MTGYRGFASKKEYEDHYSDQTKHAAEIPAMEQYAREAKAERLANEFCEHCGASIPHREGEGRCPKCAHHVALSTD